MRLHELFESKDYEEDSEWNTVYQRAIEYATDAHQGQVRKYTGEPYINHPIAVSRIVATVTRDQEMLAAAVLHDTIEDCGKTQEELAELFGTRVASLVENLSDISNPEDGNRKFRKEKDRQHTAGAHPDAKTIKLADLIHNSLDIMQNDLKFAKVYMKEKSLLLDVLKEGDQRLYKKAKSIVDKYYATNPS